MVILRALPAGQSDDSLLKLRRQAVVILRALQAGQSAALWAPR